MRTLDRDDRLPRRHKKNVQMEVEHDGASELASQSPQEPKRYPGGPYDLSVLVRYEQHRARRLWYEEERGSMKELKCCSHGVLLKRFASQQLSKEIEYWVNESGLASLQRTTLWRIDSNLLTAFAERWHSETSSFHMPYGEMTITLDDVACLLHLPIRGVFWTPDHVTKDVAVDLAVNYLGVSRVVALGQVRTCHGARYKLQWLYDLFVEHQAASSWEYATRAYLLMLVGCTIFANGYMYVDAKYLLLFRDLDGLRKYSWGAAALVTLYDGLGDACMFGSKVLTGYPTLLQCWIHEYFPSLSRKKENWKPSENRGLPRAMRWSYTTGMKLDALRPILDVLTPVDVVWRPFEDHRDWRPFDEICLFRGSLKWGGNVVLYLPDRCLRQFGLRQYIPRPPTDVIKTEVDGDWIGYDQSVVEVIAPTSNVIFPSETDPGYLSWYYRVSHPRLVPTHWNAPRDVSVPQYAAEP